MTYNIFDRTAPAMPKPSKGTEIVKLLLSQASKDMYEPLVPMLFPSLGAHLSDVEFMYYALVPRPTTPYRPITQRYQHVNQPSDNKRGEKRKNRCKSGDLDGNCGMMRTMNCNLSTV